MAEHNAPFAHIAYQHPDGTTGVLDNHDAEAIHDDAATVKTENLEDGSVTNGKIAPDAVTGVELAHASVSKEHLSPEMQASWDSLSQKIVSGSFLVNVPAGSGERFFDVSVDFPRSMETGAPIVLITDMSRRSGYSSMFTDVRAAFFESSSAGFTARIYCTCPVDKAYPRTFNYLAIAF